MHERLGVGIVGAGAWGQNLIRVFAGLSRCRLAAICDIEPARLSAYEHALPGVRCSTRFDDVLAADDISAVVLSTPPRTHARFASAALEAGKDVFVEKPMALSVREALEVRSAVRRTQKRLMVGHLLQYHPAVLELRRIVLSGALGAVRCVFCQRLGLARRARDENVWWTLAPHDISVCRFVLGANPVEIEAARHAASASEVVIARATFGAGISAFIAAGTSDGTKVRRITIVGAHKTATFDDMAANKLVVRETPGSALRGSESVLAPLDAEPLRCEAEHFVSALLDNAAIASDDEEGLWVVRTLEAGELSMTSGGRTVAIR